ncbi:GDCCVxC domain-containing (seleno)protein [Enterovibrio calviensis]|uniref:GDCCVxC domain-containing (seleno)protein n=1 Tax=Enterovibrio calviensis TaxID=91359 RepID=UPI00373571E0
MKVILKSDITCPFCGHTKTEMMPIDAPKKHYECESCHEALVAQDACCCVFCAFGSVSCPSSQVKGPNTLRH